MCQPSPNFDARTIIYYPRTDGYMQPSRLGQISRISSKVIGNLFPLSDIFPPLGHLLKTAFSNLDMLKSTNQRFPVGCEIWRRHLTWLTFQTQTCHSGPRFSRSMRHLQCITSYHRDPIPDLPQVAQGQIGIKNHYPHRLPQFSRYTTLSTLRTLKFPTLFSKELHMQ